MRTISIVLPLALFACTSKAPIEDEGIDVVADSKADLKTNTRMVGDVIYGQSLSVGYTKQPRYRSVRFSAPAGDVVDL